MADLVAKQDESVVELAKRITDLEKRSMRKNLIISGIPEEQDENCHLQATNFFRRNMHMAQSVDISGAHRIGTGTKRQRW